MSQFGNLFELTAEDTEGAEVVLSLGLIVARGWGMGGVVFCSQIIDLLLTNNYQLTGRKPCADTN